MRCLVPVPFVSTLLCLVSCGSTALDTPAHQPGGVVSSGEAVNVGGVAASQGVGGSGAGGSGAGGSVGGLGGVPGSAIVAVGSGSGCVPPASGGPSGSATSADTAAVEQELMVRWNQAARSVVTTHKFLWNAFDQFPHPTYQGGSAAAYGEFAQVLLAFFQLGDDFDFLAQNCLLRAPLYSTMANGDHGQGWTFEGLAAYFASGVYGNTPEATRLALAAFSARIQQTP